MGSTSGPRCMVSGWLRMNQSPELELDKEILENNGIALYWNTLSVSVSSSMGPGILKRQFFLMLILVKINLVAVKM
jgi:hypothetical protein